MLGIVSAAFGTTNEHGHAWIEMRVEVFQLTYEALVALYDRPATFERDMTVSWVTWRDMTGQDLVYTWRPWIKNVTWRVNITWYV